MQNIQCKWKTPDSNASAGEHFHLESSNLAPTSDQVSYNSTHTGRAIKTSAVYTETKSPLNLQKTSLVYFVNMFYRNSSNIPSQISLAKQLLLIHLSNLQLLKFTTTSAIFFNDFKIWYNPLRPRVPQLARVPANACSYFYILHVLSIQRSHLSKKNQNVQTKSQCIPRNQFLFWIPIQYWTFYS